MTGLLTLAAILWAIVITLGVAILRKSRIDAGMHPRRGEGEKQGAAHRDAKFNRSVLPGGSVHHHHGSVSK